MALFEVVYQYFVKFATNTQILLEIDDLQKPAKIWD